MTSVNCPACHEENSTDMAFCIYCGAPLKAVVSGKPAGAPQGMGGLGAGAASGGNMAASGGTGAARMSAAAARPRFCTSCGQSDTLNSQFCIFCGSKVEEPIVAGNPAASGPRPAVTPDVSMPDVSPAIKDSAARRASQKTTGTIATICASLLGIGLGLGLSWYYNNQAGPARPTVILPPHGLVILTARPHSFFQVVSTNNRRFLSGKTGADGDVSMEDLDPGDYHITVKSPEGEVWEKDIKVEASDPLVIGAPPDSELFSKQL